MVSNKQRVATFGPTRKILAINKQVEGHMKAQQCLRKTGRSPQVSWNAVILLVKMFQGPNARSPHCYDNTRVSEAHPKQPQTQIKPEVFVEAAARWDNGSLLNSDAFRQGSLSASWSPGMEMASQGGREGKKDWEEIKSEQGTNSWLTFWWKMQTHTEDSCSL